MSRKLFNNFFEDEGIDLVLNARIKSVSGKSGQSVKIVIERDGKQIHLEGSHLLGCNGPRSEHWRNRTGANWCRNYGYWIYQSE